MPLIIIHGLTIEIIEDIDQILLHYYQRQIANFMDYEILGDISESL
jgi:hypothetical protein